MHLNNGNGTTTETWAANAAISPQFMRLRVTKQCMGRRPAIAALLPGRMLRPRRRTRNFVGRLDEFTILNGVLSAKEIAWLHDISES